MELRRIYSLNQYFTKYILTLLCGLFVVLLIPMLALTFVLQDKTIIPANQVEKNLLAAESQLASSPVFDPNLIPDHVDYVYLAPQGELKMSNLDRDRAEHFMGKFSKKDLSSEKNLYFRIIERPDGHILTAYPLKASYRQPWMNQSLPSVDTLIFILGILIISLALAVFIVITMRFTDFLKKELQSIINVTDHISKQDLNFTVEKSSLLEFNTILTAMESMKSALASALTAQWQEEKMRRTQVAAMAHDLKTPVAIISGNAEFLQRTTLDEKQSTYVASILANKDRLNHYIQSLVEVNIGHSRQNLQKEEVLAAVFAKKLMKEAGIYLQSHRHPYVTNNTVHEGILCIDQEQILRAFLNLLANAIQYGKGHTISLSFYTEGNALSLKVIDQGSGFSEEDLLYAKELFYQADSSRSKKGHYGLGLAIADQIMRSHEGHLNIKNIGHQEGAEVSLILPILEKAH